MNKENIIAYLRALPDERTREYEKKIASFALQHQDECSMQLFKEIMDEDIDVSYEAFYCLETVYRRNRDYSILSALIEEAKTHKGFTERISFKHICIMYHIHSETLFDYDELLKQAHENACEMYDNSGYHHTFANAFATILERCLPEDEGRLIEKWYDSALFCVNKAIELDPGYAKFLSTKARIIAFKDRFEEANELLRRAIDLEDSRKADYALLIGNYQYYRTMIAIRRQKGSQKTEPSKAVGTDHCQTNDREAFRENDAFAFVSYSHNDASEVVSIIEKIRAAGYNVWYDSEIEAGSDWAEEIGRHIVGGNVFILMLSHSSLLSANVRNEITMAQNRGKIITPVFLEDVFLSEGAELQLQRYHWIKKFNLSQEAFSSRLFSVLQKNLVDQKHIVSKNREETSDVEPAVCPSATEMITLSKTGKEEDNEDFLYMDDHFYAVFDGATSKNSAKWNGKTGGRLAVELLADCLKGFDCRIDVRTAVSLLREKLIAFDRENRLREANVHLCASAVIYNRAKRQLWSIGDCQYMIDGVLHAPHKTVDKVFSELRSVLIHALLLDGKTEEELLEHDEAREMIVKLMEKQGSFENTSDEYGYSVLSCNGEMPKFEWVDVPSGTEIVLASDGYPILKNTLEESEKSLKDLLEKDPLCYKENRSTKGLRKGNQSFDDRTYLKFYAE